MEGRSGEERCKEQTGRSQTHGTSNYKRYVSSVPGFLKLTSKERRKRKCGLVAGRYFKDGTHAKVSESAVSIKIPNSAFKKAIGQMRRLERIKPKSTDSDYRAASSIPVWVRPNYGPGNPHTATYISKAIPRASRAGK
jgi:hypothetical protein